MNATNILKFLHVMSVITWVGGGIFIQVLMAQARKGGPEALRHFNELAEWASNHLFMPASIGALVFGIATAASGHFEFKQLWITLGFIGFAITLVDGMAILGPTAKKMKAVIAERGPNDPEVTKLANRMQMSGRIDLLVLVLVVLDMVVKPGLGS